MLGWEPRTTLADGLSSTIGYFRGLAESELEAPPTLRSGATAGRAGAR